MGYKTYHHQMEWDIIIKLARKIGYNCFLGNISRDLMGYDLSHQQYGGYVPVNNDVTRGLDGGYNRLIL